MGLPSLERLQKSFNIEQKVFFNSPFSTHGFSLNDDSRRGMETGNFMFSSSGS